MIILVKFIDNNKTRVYLNAKKMIGKRKKKVLFDMEII